MFEPVAATQPERLAILAHEHGLDPAFPDRALIFELACGDGANLLPLAYRHPHARFIGLEGSAEAATRARASISQLGLTNVEINQGSLDAIEPWAGRCDYVLVPGVLSHVADAMAEAALDACARLLAPSGVAYVDHLGASGRILSQRLRDLLRRQVASLDTVAARLERIEQILAALDTDELAKNPHAVYARLEVRVARMLGPAGLLREVLAPHRRPYAPSELARLAEARGLHVLTEAWDPSPERRVEPRLHAQLVPLTRSPSDATDLVELMTGPRLRAVLLVKERAARNRSLQEGLLAQGAFAARIEVRRDDVLLGAGIEVPFITRSAMVRTSDPLHKAVLTVLRRAWSDGLRFAELIASARELLAREVPDQPAPSEADIERQAKELLELHALDAVTWSSAHPRVATVLAERPAVSPLTRWEAARGVVLTDPQHRLVIVDELTRRLVERLDGSMTHEELQALTRSFFDSGELALEPGKKREDLVPLALDGLLKAGLLLPEPQSDAPSDSE